MGFFWDLVLIWIWDFLFFKLINNTTKKKDGSTGIRTQISGYLLIIYNK